MLIKFATFSVTILVPKTLCGSSVLSKTVVRMFYVWNITISLKRRKVVGKGVSLSVP